MPRSSHKNWQSERRLDYIDDALVTNGKITRQQIKEYFGVGIDIGSVDIGEYARMYPGTIEPQSAGWVATDGFASQRASSPARQAAWPIISPHANPSGKRWGIDRQLDWIADHPGCMAAELAQYFGIAVSVAQARLREFGKNPRAMSANRVKVWEVWE